jgi:hypothetical protein
MAELEEEYAVGCGKGSEPVPSGGSEYDVGIYGPRSEELGTAELDDEMPPASELLGTASLEEYTYSEELLGASLEEYAYSEELLGAALEE